MGHRTKAALLAVVLVGSLMATPMAVAAPPPAPEPCLWPDPCDYLWQGADLGPFVLAEVEEVWVESHDGTLLRGWLAFPALPDGVVQAPVALHSSPYLGVCHPGLGGCVPGPGTAAFWDDDPGAAVVRTWGVPPIELVRHGYVAAFFDVRGTGGSQGCLDFGGLAEQQDQAVLVEWLATQPWSNGRVAMGGNSYPAGTAWQAAVQAPDGLATIVTAGVMTDLYTLFHSPQGVNYEKLVAISAPFEVTTVWLPHAGAGGDPLGELTTIPARAGCEPFRPVSEPNASGFLRDRDAEYWEPRRYIERFDQVRSSVLMPHGLWDVIGHTFQDMLVWGALPDVHVWQISGQWGHGPPFADTPALTPEWIRENWPPILFDWLGYWLQGVGETPPQRVDYQDTTGAWRKAGKWPPPQARDQVLHLDGDRLATAPGTTDRRLRAGPSPGNDHAFASVFDLPVPAGAWAWCRQEVLPGAVADTAVAYVSEPLPTERLLAGNPYAELTLSADQPGGIVNVSLLRWPAGASCAELTDVGQLVASGGADLRYHHGGYTAEPFPVDTPTAVRVDLFNTATRFAPGDRLVVVVSGPEGVGFYSSASPHAPEVTVHADASRVVAPFVPGRLHNASETDRRPADGPAVRSLAEADATLLATAPGGLAGWDVWPAGDVDGDGYDDLLVGAWGDDEAGENAGAAYVVYGPVEGTVDLASAGARLLGEQPGDAAGEAVAGVGDLDGDGYADFVVGAVALPGNLSNGREGRAYLYYGGPERLAGTTSLADADVVFVGEHPADVAGLGLAQVGDLDGDGFDDLVITAPGYGGSVAGPGKIYIFYGGPGRLSGEVRLADADAALVGHHPGDLAGFAIAGGDLDGDGFADLIIGAQLAFGARGGAYVVYGGARRSGTESLWTAADARLIGEAHGDIAGTGVAAGDLDGDGFDDLIVGAPAGLPVVGDRPGTAYVFYGDPQRLQGTMTLAAADAAVVGEVAGDNAGRGVGTVDLDGDGADELIVGAIRHAAAGTDAGAAYVLSGGKRLADTVHLADADLKLTGVAAGDLAGRSVGGAGDVSGDGADALFVGAERHSGGAQDAGAVHLTFGSQPRGRLTASCGDRGLRGSCETRRGPVRRRSAGEGVDPAHLGEARAVGVRGAHRHAVLQRERGKVRVGDEVASWCSVMRLPTNSACRSVG